MSAVAELRARCRELLAGGRTDIVLGYRAGHRPGTAVPAFITRPDDCDRLTLDADCRQNLAAWLPGLRRQGRVTVIATGPTSRSIVNLLKENQFDREKLHIIGVSDPAESASGVADAVLFDEFVGTPAGTQSVGDRAAATAPAGDPAQAEFESRSPAERWEFLAAELGRCIRCYACRQVCPNCYCPTCFVDADRPQWVGRTPDLSDNIIFHLVRAMHMAGRCVECGACARACPMGIDLMLINRKVAAIVRERFGHVSGMSLDDPLPLATFKPEDGQEFIR
ncbi:MAG: 4Fe-4S dicluster domain-containing protein [bacterium]